MKTMKRIVRPLLISGFVASLAVAAAAQAPRSARTVGPIMASVTVDVYSDYQCPHCKVLAEETLGLVRDNYALKGKIRLVHHDFPLPQHPYAKQAAILAAAADRIGKFDQVSEALFKQQDAWSTSGKVEDVVASVLTPDEATKVRQLAKDPSVAAVVQRDIDLGTRLKIEQTPTIIITKNLKSDRVPGAVSYAILSRYLDQLLAP